ncbi:MAG: hypothetical protein EAZ17_08005 [Sphingobacteriales bacterium]|nr:MAG: hypothetical protein EAZ17_08005 [Sphingobacteriales bacterium]
MDDKLSGIESLAIIDEMIKKAKNHFSEDGSLYLFWGWLILFCSLGHYLLYYFDLSSQPWGIWGLTWLGAAYMVIHARKARRRKKVKTYTEEMIAYVWITFAILMVVSAIVLGRVIPDYHRYNFIVVLICYGMPTFLSGFILKFQPLILGGLFCWVLAFIAGFVDFHYHPLLTSAAVIVAWIIPGYILKSRYRKQML